MARVALVLALATGVSAFVANTPARAGVQVDATKADMKDLAEANPDFLGSSLGLWDPLGCLSYSFWTLGNEATIGYLRHAEIKHGRVAMAAFLGYLVQSTPFVSGPHSKLPYSGYEPGLTPPEQWDAIPLAGKLQIFTLIGMLESYGEILDVHYCNGGLPGYYPPIKGNRPEIWSVAPSRPSPRARPAAGSTCTTPSTGLTSPRTRSSAANARSTTAASPCSASSASSPRPRFPALSRPSRASSPNTAATSWRLSRRPPASTLMSR